ncbi:hypothetical protein Cme02nite_59460 [Catellatospora methionotrophica]|uniref:Uncharacterized protein n=1 Tax=Catellatospora methionotrophica TaxID=121620 RepID=A0A8J3PIC8_9ACTN|nr:hypothetical protein [Catellatospora methionotrophica]GIG17614.1 hypothetical protein Cme02nite_59460 [Catellatospora methionotrophica]
MGSELERTDQREISINVEVGTGAFLPGGKIAFGLKRAWQHRANDYLESVAAAAGSDEDRIVEAVAEGGEFADVFAHGLQALTGPSDVTYRETFAAFVANSLHDPAKIDITAFLLDKFSKLRPPHVRIFWWYVALEGMRVRQESQKGQRGKLAIEAGIVALHLLSRGGLISSSTVGVDALREITALPKGILESLIRDLINEGLMHKNSESLALTELGELAVQLIGEDGLQRIFLILHSAKGTQEIE